MARLAAEGLGLSLEGCSLLSGFTAAFEAGLVHAVVGPNGAGKTTLLRLLGLLVRPSAGRVLLGGADATAAWPDCLPLRRRLALVQQQPTLFRCSVWDNVAAGLRFRGVRGERLREEVAAALRFVGLEGYERRWPGSLSGGEAQKVALARAVATRPEVLLLDEPCASLDPGSCALIEEKVAELAAERGTTAVLVTHSLSQAARLSQRLYVLCEGRLVESGPTPEVLGRPRDELSRQFIRQGTIP
jgi:ABC-type methionine transport system ATPase subunit